QNVTANGSGSVALQATGGASDIAINGAMVSSTSGAIQLIAGQSITTSTLTGTTTEVATSGTLLLDAVNAIGTSINRIDTNVGTVAAQVTGAGTTGDIFLNEANALTIGTATGLDGRANLSGITTANNNDVTVVAAGTITVSQNVTANGSGSVALQATGGASDIAINGATVSSTSGAIQLIAGQSITTSTLTGTTTEVATSGTLLLDAVNAIGTSTNRIDTNVGTVAAQVTGAGTTGDIFLNEANALTIGTATGLDGRANLSGITTANNNDVTVVAAGTITVSQNVTANGSGSVALQATGGASDIAINGATVSSTSGAIQLIAGQSITTSTLTGTTTEVATSGTLLLDAVNAIGTSTNRIDTNVGTVAAQVTGAGTTGDIFLNE